MESDNLDNREIYVSRWFSIRSSARKGGAAVVAERNSFRSCGTNIEQLQDHLWSDTFGVALDA